MRHCHASGRTRISPFRPEYNSFTSITLSKFMRPLTWQCLTRRRDKSSSFNYSLRLLDFWKSQSKQLHRAHRKPNLTMVFWLYLKNPAYLRWLSALLASEPRSYQPPQWEIFLTYLKILIWPHNAEILPANFSRENRWFYGRGGDNFKKNKLDLIVFS